MQPAVHTWYMVTLCHYLAVTWSFAYPGLAHNGQPLPENAFSVPLREFLVSIGYILHELKISCSFHISILRSSA